MSAPRCVIDASVAVRVWLSSDDDPVGRQVRTLLRAHVAGGLVVSCPDLLYPEVGSALWKAVRFAGWPINAATTSLQSLIDLQLESHRAAAYLSRALSIGLEHGATTYDALYVALSERLDVPLYTADTKLVRALGSSFPLVSLLS